MECFTFSSMAFSLKGLGLGWWLLWFWFWLFWWVFTLSRLLSSWVAAVVRWGELRTRRCCCVFLWLCDVDLRTSLCESWASRYLILDNSLLPEHGFGCGDTSSSNHTTLRTPEARIQAYQIIFNLHVRCVYLINHSLYFERSVLQQY